MQYKKIVKTGVITPVFWYNIEYKNLFLFYSLFYIMIKLNQKIK